jgi:quinolinate synthase
MSVTNLFLIGRESDLASARGVSCEGALPAPSDPDLVSRAIAAKAALGNRAMILGHHYQRDEVIAFADVTGDSFKLAQAAAENRAAELIFFAGVHFMAESADILTSDDQKVILPDLAAGCSMADMADISAVEKAWQHLSDLGLSESTLPMTYMNSTAAIKAFTGEHGGTVCTSSNAERALRWAFGGETGREAGKIERVLFLPDQHLGRNTAITKLGFKLEDCLVYNPWLPGGGVSEEELRQAKMILWRGHCSVHARFSKANIDEYRARIPGIKILVHPECQYEVVTAADVVGSTEMIIKTIESAPVGSSWAIGTELNLVNRLATAHPEKNIHFLEKSVCFCSTMNRIDLPHLVWALESAVNGRIENQIKVDPSVSKWAKVALERMLALP